MGQRDKEKQSSDSQAATRYVKRASDACLPLPLFPPTTTMESSGTMTPVNDSPVPDPDETQPLLGAKRLPTPLPVKQLAVVCYARLAEPIA